MRQCLFTFLVLFGLLNNLLWTQTTLEVGGFLGISNYMGDLQQSTFEKNEINVALGFFSRLSLNKTLALKAHFYKGEISGTDSNYEELYTVRSRNLSFRSHLFEFGLQGELTLIWFGEVKKRVAAPYLFAGISGFYFNPQTVYEGKWVDLQPLGTEGQTLPGSNQDKYNLFQFAIPMGLGFNVNVAKKLNIGFEAGFRKTFTDYLDDISTKYPDLNALRVQDPIAAKLSFRTPEVLKDDAPDPQNTFRGNPKEKDFYFFAGITFSTYVAQWHKVKFNHRKRK